MGNNLPYKPNITNDEINQLPINNFKGELFYIDTFKKLRKVMSDLKGSTVLGFDTETRPTFKKGRLNEVSLLQLSTKNKAFLFRLNKIGLPKEVKGILSDDSVLKIGVAIRDDISSLRKLDDFKPSGFIELQEYVKNFGIEDSGLKKLVANILGFKISKRQQTSNWEADELTQAQILYAATDAWVCQEIYHTLSQ